MTTVTTKDGVQIFYKDWGPKTAQPIVFHHGWPLSSDDWDAQMLFFVGKGYRVIAHDRRGHGRSTQVSDGHDMDHYAADVADVVEKGRDFLSRPRVSQAGIENSAWRALGSSSKEGRNKYWPIVDFENSVAYQGKASVRT